MKLLLSVVFVATTCLAYSVFDADLADFCSTYQTGANDMMKGLMDSKTNYEKYIAMARNCLTQYGQTPKEPLVLQGDVTPSGCNDMLKAAKEYYHWVGEYRNHYLWYAQQLKGECGKTIPEPPNVVPPIPSKPTNPNPTPTNKPTAAPAPPVNPTTEVERSCTVPSGWCVHATSRLIYNFDCTGSGNAGDVVCYDGVSAWVRTVGASCTERAGARGTILPRYCPKLKLPAEQGVCNVGSGWCNGLGHGLVRGSCSKGGTALVCYNTIGQALMLRTHDNCHHRLDTMDSVQRNCGMTQPVCTAPWDFCVGPPYTAHKLDCDGDGKLDIVCLGGPTAWVMRSSDHCKQQIGPRVDVLPRYCSKLTSSTPKYCNRPSGFCVHAGAVFIRTDCSGSGNTDAVCYDAGSAWVYRATHNCELRAGAKATTLNTYCPKLANKVLGATTNNILARLIAAMSQ